ncbi:ribose-phosphate pyrophosphokinase [Bacillus paranthracis]|uniref:ribose-phosphate pyrophosphokinase n=1 Tax=Bacillus cereus group TaxID=86661 RepID=UPI0022DFAB9F|nr:MULTISPECIES: ribose-phosphate pyrophosphokinase [Bacillus cereus group]MDA1918241.1 ribose-phosphate pyrophosphokinase [Bacillus cereus group sp. BcHK140]MDA1977179.1 ribose-phosphate pyrophosphokinase [Bacillus cereus]MEC4620742.1 ribose-phosphate pyrophosphokinase [Bacillus paranthracis]
MIKLNGKVIEFNKFPNGETKIDGEQITKALSFFTENYIMFKYESDDDFFKLMMLKRFLDESSSKGTILDITYMPYSRMDRRMGSDVFTLKYVCDFINSLNFSQIYVHESHSDVAVALLNNCIALEDGAHLFELVSEKIEFDAEKDYVFFPDAGAQKRYSKLGLPNELVGFKKRNVETGKIESLQVIGDIEPGRKVIILDDLSSFGGTFMMSAASLKELGAGDIFLAVTHCEDSIFKGKIPESELITKVYTSDSIINESTHEKVEIIYPMWSGEEDDEGEKEASDDIKNNRIKEFESVEEACKWLDSDEEEQQEGAVEAA